METTNNSPRDPDLWKLAGKRVSFRRHLYTYLVLNAFFWMLWLFGKGSNHTGVPWPAWAMLGWGIGLALDYFDTYHGNKKTMTEKEYEKLTQDKK